MYNNVNVKEEEENAFNIKALIFLIIVAVGLIIGVTILNSCTLSLQNISTHGTATDLGDEQLSTTPTVSTSLNVPLKPIP